jgi:hypothetical protein
MGDRSLSHPKRNTATRQRLFEIVDNQRWLLGAIDVEFGDLFLHPYLELCPLSGDEVDIGLVLAGSFTAELIPCKPWNRQILDRMVPLQLILRSPILGSNVEALEM